MKIGVLTSSRADYGIYLPLLTALKKDTRFELSIIAFGSHTRPEFGETIKAIYADSYTEVIPIDNLLVGDSPEIIAKSYANTVSIFADFWSERGTEFNLIFCLGDRFEMAAAVNAGIPFQLKFAHFHAGEITLGAIDNIYRHQLTLASHLHFVSLEINAEKVWQLTGLRNTTTVIGSLSLLNQVNLPLLSISEFYEKWKIDLSIPTILITVNPETVNFEKNEAYAEITVNALRTLASEFQLVINPPNADTNGSIFRNAFYELQKENDSIKIVESFGSQSYFSCMKHSALLLGNTSSGIIEAASFQKYVINIGDRQKGRFAPENVIDIEFVYNQICDKARTYINKEYLGENPYFRSDSIELTINKLLQTENDLEKTSDSRRYND
ncbi:MAG: UDP-N-acetylglucosamine 2-epimerase (hydrolyzing) [Flavobacteriales bacterium]|nr:UDP-N-acetylglucosamine 2-epimerase (hydrolyzing) [Flavobacteriales bacterium]